MYPKSFEKLVDSFKMLPGVGQKTAERYAFTILGADKETVRQFSESMNTVSQNIRICARCGNITESELCSICEDTHRDASMICVVQEAKDVAAMEKMQEFHGVYHVLNGVISSSKGIMPEDINIQSLLNRVNEGVKEVILATNPTIEGETTALYLAKLLAAKNILVTRIAHGLPMGGHLDYADELTLIKAFEGRNAV